MPEIPIPSPWRIPKKEVPNPERPRAPLPPHPDDTPFDPEQDKKWRKDRGLPPREDDRSKRSDDDGNLDPNNVVEYL